MPERGHAVFGIELECCVPYSVLRNADIGEYHRGIHYAGGWVAEHDASIHGGLTENEVEFVSPIFALADLDKTIDALEKKVGPRIRINKTCGCHIHFSWVPEGKTQCNSLYKQIPVETLAWMRDTVKERVKKNFPQISENFNRQYNRDYAKPCKKLDDMTEHCSEFCFTQDTGVEWRGFNLNGVSDWDTIRGMVRIGCQTVEDALNDHLAQDVFFDIEPPDDKGQLMAEEWSIFDKAGFSVSHI